MLTSEVKKQLCQAKTHPVMTNRIMAALYQLVGGYEVTLPNITNHNNNLIDRAFREQKEIGFKNMFKGYMTLTFQTAQEHYYKATNLNNRLYNGARWSKILVTSLHRFLINMWKFRFAMMPSKGEKWIRWRYESKGGKNN